MAAGHGAGGGGAEALFCLCVLFIFVIHFLVGAWGFWGVCVCVLCVPCVYTHMFMHMERKDERTFIWTSEDSPVKNRLYRDVG